MKKLTLFLLALLLTVGVSVAAATPVDELTDLSEYLPAEAPVFITVRTDDGYVEALDGLLASIIEQLPESAAPPGDVSVSMTLDAIVQGTLSDPEATFADVRPWLGDSVAISVTSAQSLTSGGGLVYLLAVSDRDAAAEFLEAELVAEDGAFGFYTAEEQDDGSILYTSEFSVDSSVLLADEVLVIGDFNTGIAELVLPGADAVSLDQTEDFQSALEALPEDDYNVITYLDLDSVAQTIVQLLPFILGENTPQIDPETLSEAVGRQAIGLTILEERSLVLDYAQVGSIVLENDPIDLSLLERVPADTILLIEGQGIGSLINTLFDALDLLDSFLVDIEVLPVAGAGDLGPDDIGTFIRLAVEGTFSIDLDETLAWMDGDFITYSVLNLENIESIITTGLENGTIIATDNPEATAEFVAGQAQRIMNIFAPATFEDGVLTVPTGALVSQPEEGIMITTSTDEFFVSGTQGLVEFALEPDGDDVTSTDSYAFESGLFLPETSALWYIDLVPVQAEADTLVELGQLSEEDAEMLEFALNLFDTSSITVSRGEGFSASRFTLTLGE